MTRLLLAAAALGTLTGLLLTFGTGGAVGVAVCAGAVIAWFGVRAVRTDDRPPRTPNHMVCTYPWCPYFPHDCPKHEGVTR